MHELIRLYSCSLTSSYIYKFSRFIPHKKTATGAVVVHCGQKSASFPCAGKKDYNCDATLCGNCNGITNEYILVLSTNISYVTIAYLYIGLVTLNLPNLMILKMQVPQATSARKTSV